MVYLQGSPPEKTADPQPAVLRSKKLVGHAQKFLFDYYRIYTVRCEISRTVCIKLYIVELAFACERSAFEEKADALVEEKAKEMMKKIDATSYRIEKRIDCHSGGRDSLYYTVTFDKYKPAEISAGIMPTFLLDIFSDYTPGIRTNWDRELETDLRIQKKVQEIQKRLYNY